MTNKEKQELKQEVDEMVGLIQFEKMADRGCHFKGWLDGELRWGFRDSKFERTKKLVGMCRVAILKKNWQPVYKFLCECLKKGL